MKLVNQSRQTLFPIVVGALYQNSKQHWNGTVHGLTYNVLKLLMEADPALFDDCSAQHRVMEDREMDEQRIRDMTWTDLQQNFEKSASQTVKDAWSPEEVARRP